jgi:hypothetical protein
MASQAHRYASDHSSILPWRCVSSAVPANRPSHREVGPNSRAPASSTVQYSMADRCRRFDVPIPASICFQSKRTEHC